MVAQKTIERSVLLSGAEALKILNIEHPEDSTVGDIKKLISEKITDQELKEFKTYCKASSEYIVIENA